MDNLNALTALAVAVIVGFAGMFFGFPVIILIPVALALGAVSVLGDYAARREDVSSSGPAATSSSLVKASGVALLVFGIWYYVENPLRELIEAWWIFPLLAISLLTFWYVQHRRQVASSETALRRTRRTANRRISSWTSFILGSILVVLTAGTALLQGTGDALAPFADDVAYLLTVALGYVQLGGDAGGIGGMIPALAPLQWLGIAFIVAGVGKYIESQA